MRKQRKHTQKNQDLWKEERIKNRRKKKGTKLEFLEGKNNE